MAGRRPLTLTYSGALSFSLYHSDPDFRRLLFVIPLDPLDSSEWLPLMVQLAPRICTERLSVRTAAAVAALHCGILGIPDIAVAAGFILPSYRAVWVEYGRLGQALTDFELNMVLADESVVGRGVWIVPTTDTQFGWNDQARTTYLARLYKGIPKEDVSRSGQTNFRDMILRIDNNRCVVSGDSKIVDATHIINSYIGDVIFGGTMAAIESLCSIYPALDSPILHQAAQEPRRFADIRHPPAQFPLNSTTHRTNQHDNGELRTPTHHRNKDLFAGEGVSPHDEILLWFDEQTAGNNVALTNFGLLRQYPSTVQGPAAGLFKNPDGTQSFSPSRFFPRTLALYNIFCRRFLPGAAIQEITASIAQLVTLVSKAGERPRESGDGHICDHCGGGIDGGDGGGLVRGLGTGGAIDADSGTTGLPASTSTGSNSSQGTLVNRGPFRQIWWEVADADHYKPAEFEAGDAGEEERERVKTHLLSVLDLPPDLSVKELEDYHRSLVLQASCLLHLGAALEDSERVSRKGSSPPPPGVTAALRAVE
ncbi:hypothetical protein C8R47DRAFT_499709 [Mycena vitilis]|nr:hypothetical protein C8R47DRAFT_499709 [Mycena vitilis]